VKSHLAIILSAVMLFAPLAQATEIREFDASAIRAPISSAALRTLHCDFYTDYDNSAAARATGLNHSVPLQVAPGWPARHGIFRFKSVALFERLHFSLYVDFIDVSEFGLRPSRQWSMT
jgi:hypothetical protein